MNKIIVILKGGIGNQLFIYAAAKRLALINNAELVLDDKTGFEKDYIYKRKFQLQYFNISCRRATPSERLKPFSSIRRYILLLLNRFQSSNKNIYIQQVQDEFDESLLSKKIFGTVYFEGYWQSEEYFKDIESSLRDDLKIRPSIDKMNIKILNKILDHTSIAIHVRFYDAKTALDLNYKLKDYYQNAVKKIKNQFPNCHFFLFSDNPNEAKKVLDIPNESITVVRFNNKDNQEYLDLWLMSNCNHFILSNSSFGWWSAWLAESKNKLQYVIVPKYRFDGGVEIPLIENLYPSRWILM
jgi:hypothetical protein